MKFYKTPFKTEADITNNMITRSKIQTAMNTTRDKLKMGSFNPNAFEVVPLTIKDKRIPKQFNNYTLVHLTDIHLGQWINKTRLDGIIKITNKLQPDLIALTGDYISYQTKNYL